jgi:hypothetical protein
MASPPLLVVVRQPARWRTQCWAVRPNGTHCGDDRRSRYLTCLDHDALERYARALYFTTSAPVLEEAPLPAPGTCRGCGCTDERACGFGCAWIEDDLCSQCVPLVRLPPMARPPKGHR